MALNNVGVYTLDGKAIGRARAVVREHAPGQFLGAVCFHNEEVGLEASRMLIAIPDLDPSSLPEGVGQTVRELAPEDELASMHLLRFRMTAGAPPLWLVESD